MKAICYAISTGIILSVCCLYAAAQSTQITYQGSLKDGANPANGNHDFEFLLYDALAGGGQLGTTITLSSVAVNEGTFSVKLDFGAQFPGANRFLEIRVRQTGGGAFTPLAPRQQIASAPYSIKSLTADTAATASNAANATSAVNALQLGGIAANQYVVTGDSRLSDARAPSGGSANYVQNTTSPQADSNFNISGNGTAAGTLSGNVVNATTHLSIGGQAVVRQPPGTNFFVGGGAGNFTTTGSLNAFFGLMAGNAITTGGSNSFFGNTVGSATTTGIDNSLFGHAAGSSNTIGSRNSFFGKGVGINSISGESNAFFGGRSGTENTTGSRNSFFGTNAGNFNTTGSNNTAVGDDADVALGNLTFATAIGSGAVVSSSNTVVLGRSLDAVQIPGTMSVTGAFTANGSALTNLNAGNITAGTLDPARLANGAILNTTTQQPASNFNISGTGTVGLLNVTSSYQLGGNRVLGMLPDAGLVVGWAAGHSNTTGVQNSFVGSYAGGANTTGSYNSFFGRSSGEANTTGFDNSFFGQVAGLRTTTGNSNSYFGSNSGQDNTTGSENSFFGQSSGLRNTTGSFNSFYGRNSGRGNTTGNHNSFLGIDAGRSNTNSSSGTFLGSNAGFSNTIGVNNTFVGAFSGLGNTEGANNSFIGALSGDGNTTGFNNVTLGVAADFGFPNLSNAAAIGTSALVNCSNCMVLGSINGINDAVADTNVGIGTTSPSNRLHIVANGGNLVLGNPGCNPGIAAIGFVATLSGCNNYAILGDGGVTVINRPTGAVIEFREGNATQARFAAGGVFSLNSLGAAGATALCRNASNQISTCSSSIRYKTNVADFSLGLDLITKLRPVSFNWKDGGSSDMGLVAEEVAQVETLLTTTNKNGEVEGVKYDRIGVVLINAVKEQQAQIEALQEELGQLRKELAEMRSVRKGGMPK